MANTVRRARTCEVCGASYRPTYHQQRTCGRACGASINAAYLRAKDRPRFSKVIWRKCTACDRAYTTGAGKSCGCDAPRSRVFVTCCCVCDSWFCTPYTTSTCSAACAVAKRKRDKRSDKDRRRALKRDAFVAPVYRLKVYERDGWRCHLCNKKVKRDAVVPHPLAATLDHVIPLAAGGTHEPSNCRTAHYLCNSRKGSGGGGEQLMLVG